MGRLRPRTIFALFLGLALFASSLPIQAAELAAPGTRERKFQRGLLNVFLSPVEISTSLESVKGKTSFPPSWLFALFGGTIKMVIRAVTGVYEIVTFPIAWPREYKPLYQPEFALEHLGLLKDET